MLVTGNVQKDEYEKLAELVEKLTKTISVKNILSEYQKPKTAIIF
jgi:diphthamide synthase (EF-2-diphthine--ammonia ligase)